MSIWAEINLLFPFKTKENRFNINYNENLIQFCFWSVNVNLPWTFSLCSDRSASLSVCTNVCEHFASVIDLFSRSETDIKRSCSTWWTDHVQVQASKTKDSLYVVPLWFKIHTPSNMIINLTLRETWTESRTKFYSSQFGRPSSFTDYFPYNVNRNERSKVRTVQIKFSISLDGIAVVKKTNFR